MAKLDSYNHLYGLYTWAVAQTWSAIQYIVAILEEKLLTAVLDWNTVEQTSQSIPWPP